MQNLCQPRFHVGSRTELVTSTKGADKGLLDEFLGFVWMLSQMESNTIQVIEMNHRFTRKGVPLGASSFSLPRHAGILSNRRSSV
jgi:hypothetical protein